MGKLFDHFMLDSDKPLTLEYLLEFSDYEEPEQSWEIHSKEVFLAIREIVRVGTIFHQSENCVVFEHCFPLADRYNGGYVNRYMYHIFRSDP